MRVGSCGFSVRAFTYRWPYFLFLFLIIDSIIMTSLCLILITYRTHINMIILTLLMNILGPHNVVVF